MDCKKPHIFTKTHIETNSYKLFSQLYIVLVCVLSILAVSLEYLLTLRKKEIQHFGNFVFFMRVSISMCVQVHMRGLFRPFFVFFLSFEAKCISL